MSTYSNLKIEEITLGDSGWGTTTTNNLLAVQQTLQGVTLATGDFATNVATLTLTNTNALQNARALCLTISATLTGAGTINVPAITGGKMYLVINNSVGGYAVTVKVTGLTGVSVPNGKAMWLWNNGTDVVDGVNYISSLALGAALPLTSGGTGQTTANAAFNALAPAQTTANGKYLKSDGANTSWDAIDLSTSDISGVLPVVNGGSGVTTSTGSGSTVLSNSPTLVTPALGTPTSGNLANCTFPTLNQNTTGTAAGLSVTLAVASGGTGQTSYTDGQLLIGNSTGNTLTKATLTAGSGVSIANGNGSISISATGSGGTVTSVSWTGGVVSVANGTTTPAFTIAGTSGGVPYFSSGTTWASSAVLAANAIVLGGGTGAPPATTTTGTGVVTALGVNTGSAGAFVVNGGALGTPSSGALTNCTADGTNSVGYRNVPQNSQTGAYVLVAADVGKHISITTGGVTCNASVFSAGDAVSIYNNSGSNQTITAGTNVTFRLAGTATTGNRTLAQYGVITLLCVTGGANPVFVVSGAGVT